MPAITVRVRNMGRLQAKVKKLPLDIQAGVIIGLRGIATPMEEDVKRTIRTGTRSGKIVKRYYPARVVQASAPYEVPANDRGMLANSIEVDVDPTQFNLTLSATHPMPRSSSMGRGTCCLVLSFAQHSLVGVSGLSRQSITQSRGGSDG